MDLGDGLRIIPDTSAQVGQPTEPVYIPSTKPVYMPPLICLVTPPRLNENVTIDLTKPEPKGLSSCVRVGAKENYRKIYFNPGRRIYSTQLINSRPVLICVSCKIISKSEFFNDCFSCNYHYEPQKIERKKNLEVKKVKKPFETSHSKLRNKLRDLFGESDISD